MQRKALAGAVAAVAVVWLVLDWHRVVGDFIPLDRSAVGPNLLAAAVQWAIVLVVAVLVWPPTRRRIHRFVDRKTDKLHDHISSVHTKIDVLESHHHELMKSHERIAEQLERLHPEDEER